MNDFDFTGTHKPIDKTTALVMSKGEDFVLLKRQIKERWESRPPKRKLKTVALKMLYNEWKYKKFGKFMVIGLYKHKRGRWIVKCNCGMYELRTLRAIKNPDNFGDRCGYCEIKAYDLYMADVRRNNGKHLKKDWRYY